VNHEGDLIDTAEMYLRTMLELEEEGVVVLRARIAERIGHTVPTASQTIARMERDGQVIVTATRRLQLTPQGRLAAVRVMRKHRLAECLLADVLGLEWQLLHEEACRWEHVMSDAVERRMVEILGHPTHSPYGNPIPGLAELGGKSGPLPGEAALPGELVTLAEAPTAGGAVIRRITERLQSNTAMLGRLYRAGISPGTEVSVSQADGQLLIGTGDHELELDIATAAQILVTPLQDHRAARAHSRDIGHVGQRPITDVA
jgi:DtxR family transcriptional regulator, Mn-dependent transcriptional regulator